MAQYIEDAPLVGSWVRQNGLKTKQAVDFSSASSVALPAGVTAGAQTITSSSATAFVVGPSGTTNPTFTVDASVANAVTGIKIQGQVVTGGAQLTVTSSGTNEALLIDAKGNSTVGINTSNAAAGLVTIGNATSLAGVAINGPITGAATTITSTSANSLAVGRQGTTNPVLQIDASTASVANGISVKGTAAGSGVTIQVISSGSNDGLTIASKGTGNVTINAGQTGGTGTVLFSTAGGFGPSSVLNFQFTDNNHQLQINNGSQAIFSMFDGLQITTSSNNPLNLAPNGTGGTVITSPSANSLVVGRQGSTNPVLQVDSSTGSVVTGIKIKGAAAGSAPVVSVISSDSALAMVLQALTTTNSLTINDTLAAATNPLLAGIATDVITGAVTDAFTGGLRLSPTINSAGANTVTRHNYIDLVNVVLGGAGPAAVTDAAVIRFNAAPGTHKALAANGSVATVLGSIGPTGAQTTVQGWLKFNVNGTLRYTPFF